MIFRVRLKKIRKPTQPRLRFDLEKLRNPNVAGTVPATIGGKCAPLIRLRDGDTDIDSMITTYNTAMIDTGKNWVTIDILDYCGAKRELKRGGMKQKDRKNI